MKTLLLSTALWITLHATGCADKTRPSAVPPDDQSNGPWQHQNQQSPPAVQPGKPTG